MGRCVTDLPLTSGQRSHLFWLVAIVVIAVWNLWLGAFACATVLALGAVACALSLAGLLRAERRVGRVSRGCCPECGYDLRSTPHRCPECGHVPPHGVRMSFADWLAAEFHSVHQHWPDPPPGRRQSVEAVSQPPGESLDNPPAPGNNPPK